MVYQKLIHKPENTLHGRGRLGSTGRGESLEPAVSWPAPGSQLHFGAALSPDTIAGLFHQSAVGRPFALPKRQAVYGSLDDDRSIYLIERGQVKAVATSPGGKECLIGIYAAGEVFGELAIICAQRTEMVTTMTPVVLRRMNAATALDALSDTDSRDEFIRRLAHRLFEQQRLIIDLVTTDSEHRLAAILLYLGHKLGQREGSLLRIESRITQEELSGMVGTTRSRVGYFLKRFVQANMVARNGSSSLILHEPRIREFIACG